MSRPATTRLKCNPVLGSPPTLEWRSVGELLIDPTYQRSIETGASQTLIRKIAQFWDWGLCQPLAVSRRPDGSLTIVDGQHRASAAKLRGDIPHLPCVITSYANAGDEAAAFVALNQQRRPLNGLDIFKAALAAGDMEASQINLALADAGLRLASSTNLQSIRPGALSNVAALKRCYRVHGVQVLTATCRVIAEAYPGEVLAYAGTIFPGIEALAAAGHMDDDRLSLMTAMVRSVSQKEWYKRVSARTGEVPTRRAAAASVFIEAWQAFGSRPGPKLCEKAPIRPRMSFEEQLERVSKGASISEKIVTHRSPDHTLGGVTGEII